MLGRWYLYGSHYCAVHAHLPHWLPELAPVPLLCPQQYQHLCQGHIHGSTTSTTTSFWSRSGTGTSFPAAQTHQYHCQPSTGTVGVLVSRTCCDSNRNNIGAPLMQATAPARVRVTPVSPQQHQHGHWCACCSQYQSHAYHTPDATTTLSHPYWYQHSCHARTGTSTIIGTSTPVSITVIVSRRWDQQPITSEPAPTAESVPPLRWLWQQHRGRSRRPATPTPLPEPSWSHSTAAPEPPSLTDPAMRMMMRSGSRAMVKMKRPKAGPKAMKVHPKKTASVISAGAGTRDRGRTRSSDRTGPAAPSPSAALPGPMTPGVRAPPAAEAASRGGPGPSLRVGRGAGRLGRSAPAPARLPGKGSRHQAGGAQQASGERSPAHGVTPGGLCRSRSWSR